MAETFVETQVRLVLEKQCRESAELLAKSIPAGVGFVLVLADFGAKGNVAYVSSCERESASKLFEDLLGKWSAERGWTVSAEDCPCCHECLAPGLDTDIALVIAFVLGIEAAGAGPGPDSARLLCAKHARLASQAAAFATKAGGRR